MKKIDRFEKLMKVGWQLQIELLGCALETQLSLNNLEVLLKLMETSANEKN